MLSEYVVWGKYSPQEPVTNKGRHKQRWNCCQTQDDNIVAFSGQQGFSYFAINKSKADKTRISFVYYYEHYFMQLVVYLLIGIFYSQPKKREECLDRSMSIYFTVACVAKKYCYFSLKIQSNAVSGLRTHCLMEQQHYGSHLQQLLTRWVTWGPLKYHSGPDRKKQIWATQASHWFDVNNIPLYYTEFEIQVNILYTFLNLTWIRFRLAVCWTWWQMA